MQEYRTNRNIRAREVRVIDDQGEQLGVIVIDVALQTAGAKGLDLVEVSPKANPPVCKIMDYGKFLYQQKKSKRGDTKKASAGQMREKEVKLKPNIGAGDFEFKSNQAKKFLEKGHALRVTCQMRGREISRPETAKELIQKFVDGLAEVGKPESIIQMRSARICSITLKPGKNKAVLKKQEEAAKIEEAEAAQEGTLDTPPAE